MQSVASERANETKQTNQQQSNSKQTNEARQQSKQPSQFASLLAS